MKFKGVTTLQLFNAKTGEKECEVRDTNMFTNALSRIGSGMGIYRHIRFSGYSNIGGFGGGISPLWEKALRGIVLYDTAIPENADMILLPETVGVTGHAGSSYSGDALKRGSFNANESGTDKIEGGVRLVWDFGTDKANGTIAGASLTSLAGGNVFVPNGIADIATASTVTETGWNDYCFCGYDLARLNTNSIGTIYHNKPGGYLYPIAAEIDAEGNLVVYSLNTTSKSVEKVSSKKKVGLTDYIYNDSGTSSSSEVSNVLTDESITTSYGVKFGYGEKFHLCYLASTSSLVHKIYSKSGVLESNRTIAITGGTIGTSYNDITYDGEFYYFSPITYNGGGVFVASASGEYIGGVSGLKSYSRAQYNIQRGATIVRSGQTATSVNYQFVIKGAEILGSFNSLFNSYNIDFVPYATPKNCAPFVLYVGAGSTVGANNASTINVYFNPCYLATINNLATPVTKTSAQVMKVTYDITES